jgi:17beta-estradiol 17-dehydrogenase / very-long-chain 3-oxoacyl-CoA reductase
VAYFYLLNQPKEIKYLIMEISFHLLSNLICQAQVPFIALALIGLWALTWWCYENFKSVIQIIKNVLTPYFQPQENKTLLERYGKWAGKK